MKLWIDHTAWASSRARTTAAQLERREIASVAVIKFGALGDLLLTRPFLITARELFPAARLTFSAASHYLSGVPQDLVDRVHVAFGKDQRHRSFGEAWRNVRELGPHDLVFDLTANARSLWLTRLTPARLKVGFIPSGGHRHVFPLIYDVAVPRSEYKFEAETFLDQLCVLGADPAWPLRFAMPAASGGSQSAEHEGAAREGDTIVYFPGASDSYKCWPAESFAELIVTLARGAPSHRHLVLSGTADWEVDVAQRVVDLVGGRAAVALVRGGETTDAVLRTARVVVANDTGVRNWAIALGVPTVGLFISTLPHRYLPRFGGHRGVWSPDGGHPRVSDAVNAVREVLASSEAP